MSLSDCHMEELFDGKSELFGNTKCLLKMFTSLQVLSVEV